MLVVVSRPQTDPSAGALGGLDDHRKHARAREHAEKRGRARTRCCQAQGVTRRPHFRPRTRGLRTRPHDSLHSRVRGSRSHKSRAWRQPKRPSPVRDARAAHGSWRRRGKRKRWSWRGETAVTPLAREVRSPRAPGEGHVPGRVVTVSCKRVTCPRGNHLTGELLSVLLRVARSRHPPARTSPTRGPCARSKLQTRAAVCQVSPADALPPGALPRLAPAGHLLAFQGYLLSNRPPPTFLELPTRL